MHRAIALLTIGAVLAPGTAFATATTDFTKLTAEGATNDAAMASLLRRADAATWHLREPHCYKAAARFFKCRISQDQNLDAGGLVCLSRYDVRKKVRSARPVARRTSIVCRKAPNARP